MNVRAKFRCQSVTTHAGGGEEVRLSAVSPDSEDNKAWSKWTPSGELSMYISNEAAHGAFEPGVDYFLDITKASAESA